MKGYRFYYRFTLYKDLFSKDQNTGIFNTMDKFDEESENAFLYDADNLATFMEVLKRLKMIPIMMS